MTSRYPTDFSAAVRRLLAQRMSARAALSGMAARTGRTDRGRRSGPSSLAMRHELESFRRAQGAAYWHHEDHPR